MLPLQIEITRFHKAFGRGESRSAIEGRIQAIVADLMETAPASLGQICKELAPLELTSAAKNSLYQILSPASSPRHIAMYHQCNVAIEDFADHFNVVCREGNLVLSRAELQTLGAFFTKLLNQNMREVHEKTIHLPHVDFDQMELLLHFVRGDAGIDLEDVNTWLTLNTLSTLFMADYSYLQNLPFPSFDQLSDVVAVGQHPIASMDLSRFGDEVQNSHLEAVRSMNLRSLKVHSIHLTSSGTIAECMNLISLDMSHCAQLTDPDIEKLSTLTSLRYFNMSDCPLVTTRSLHRFTALETLNLSSCVSVNDSHLSGLSSLTRLNQLDLSFTTSLKGHGLSQLTHLKLLTQLILDSKKRQMRSSSHTFPSVGLLTNLKVLSICHAHIGISISHLSSLENLQVLNIKGAESTNAFGFLEALTSLRTLDFGMMGISVSVLKEAPIEKLAFYGDCRGIENLPHLTSLRFRENYTAIDANSPSKIAQLTLLQELQLERCRANDEMLLNLTSLQKLRRFKLHFSLNARSFSFLTALTSLTHLHLSKCSINEEALSNIVLLTGLATLKMETIHNPATQSLSKLSALSMLTELQIEGFTITNQSIASLQSLTRLKKIAFNFDHFEADLQQFPWFAERANLVSLTTGSKPGLSSTMGAFTTLKQLCYRLRESTAIPADIAQIAFLPTLTELSLNCYQIADMSLAPLQSLKKLTMLSLTECNFLTDAALIHLAGLPKLRKLIISDGQINGTGFSHLASSAISELDLFFSKGLSNDGLAQIAKISSLQILKLGKSRKTSNDGIALLAQLPLLRELVVRRRFRFSSLNQLKLLKEITVEH